MRKITVFALAALLPLAACGRNDPPPATPAAPTAPTSTPPADTALGRTVQAAMAKASEELANENISVGGNSPRVRVGKDISALPKAEITPQGDLLIEGKAVPVDAAQRELLLAHRANIIGIAQAGIAVGMQGADLGIKAATGALKSVFSGNTSEFEQEMEAEGRRIEEQANRLICTRLPALLASQQALAAALPAFQPYATMNQSDVDECGKDGNFNVDAGGTQATVQVQSDADTDTKTDSGHHDDAAGMDAAAEADAAAKGSSTGQ